MLIRGEKVIFSSELAGLYGVAAKVLIQAVKRNADRFPSDFMIQLTSEEYQALRSQFVTLKGGRGQHAKYPPYAFSELGVAMLSSVLRSDGAVKVNIEIMRAFVRLRGLLASHRDLAKKLEALENKYDVQFAAGFEAIRQLMEPPPEKPKGRIGLHSPRGRASADMRASQKADEKAKVTSG